MKKLRHRTLTRSERVLVLLLGALVFALFLDTSLRRLYLEPRKQLLSEIEAGSSAVLRMRHLQARAADIQQKYEALVDTRPQGWAAVESESAILLEIEKLARDRIRVLSVQPRSGAAGESPTMHLSLEAISDLAGLGDFLQRAIEELGSVVTSMTLTAEGANPGGPEIRSRIELDVVYDGS